MLAKFLAKLKLTLEKFSSNWPLLKSYKLSSEVGRACLVRMARPKSGLKSALQNHTGKSSTKITPAALPNSVTACLSFHSPKLYTDPLRPLTARIAPLSPAGWRPQHRFQRLDSRSLPSSPSRHGFLGDSASAAPGSWCHVMTLGSVHPRELPCLLLDRLFLGRALSPNRRQAATRYFLDMML